MSRARPALGPGGPPLETGVSCRFISQPRPRPLTSDATAPFVTPPDTLRSPVIENGGRPGVR